MIFRHDVLRDVQHALRDHRVECRRVLVEQQHARRVDRRHQQRYRLALSARQQADPRFHAVLQTHVEPCELLAEERALFARQRRCEKVSACSCIRERHVFLQRQIGRCAAHRVLKDTRNALCALVFGQVGDVLAVEHNASPVHEKAAGDRAEQRGLARAVRADDRDELAVLKREIDTAQRVMCARRACAEGLVELFERQHTRFSFLSRPARIAAAAAGTASVAATMSAESSLSEFALIRL